SSAPTRAPSAFSARARFTDVVDLPTPPLPEPTAITLRMRGWGERPFWTRWAAGRTKASFNDMGISAVLENRQMVPHRDEVPVSRHIRQNRMPVHHSFIFID